MKRPLAITSLLFILIAYVESIESSMADDEVYQCFVKLVCLLGKTEEIYNIIYDAGPKNSKAHTDVIKQVADIDIPEFTLENYLKAKYIFCKWSKEQKKKMFFEYSIVYGERYMDFCQQPDAEQCIKADRGVGEFASLLVKYKATGDCPIIGAVPFGMDKIGSSPFG